MTDTPRLRLPSSAPAWDNSGTDMSRADGCANTNIGPGRSVKEIDVGTSLPSAADDPQHPLDIERMARLDGCPACVVNTALPNVVCDTVAGFRAHYTCTDCGHDWFTDWRD